MFLQSPSSLPPVSLQAWWKHRRVALAQVKSHRPLTGRQEEKGIESKKTWCEAATSLRFSSRGSLVSRAVQLQNQVAVNSVTFGMWDFVL